MRILAILLISVLVRGQSTLMGPSKMLGPTSMVGGGASCSPITDNFTGTNGQSLSAYQPNWIIDDTYTFTIQTVPQSVWSSFSSGSAEAHWSASNCAFTANQAAQTTVAALNGDFFGPVVHATATANGSYYRCVMSNGASGNLLLQLENNGTETSLGSATVTAAVNDVVRLEITGTSLNCKHNGTSAITATDGTLTTGQPGISSFSNTASDTGNAISQWQGTNI